MKKLLKVLVGFMLVYIGVTFAAGFYVKYEHDKLLRMVARDLSDIGVRVIEQRYQRGVFVSHSHVLMTFPAKMLTEGEVYLSVDSTIRSGPWLGGAEFGLSKVDTVIAPPADEDLQGVWRFWQGQNLAVAQTVVGFFQDRQNEIKVLPLQYTDENTSIDFSGGVGTIDFSTLGFSFPHYVYKDRNGEISMDGLSFHIFANSRSGVFNGVVSFDQAHLVDVKDDAQSMAISDLFLDVRSASVVRDLINGQMKGRMTLTRKGQPMRFEMASEVQNIYQPAWEGLRKMDAAAFADVAQRKRLMDEVALEFLRASPSLELDLSMTQEGQTAYVRGNLGLDTLSESDRLTRNISLLMLTRGQGRVEVKIPRVLMNVDVFGEDLYAMLNEMFKANLLAEDGRNYLGEYSYGNQMLVVNNRKIDLF